MERSQEKSSASNHQERLAERQEGGTDALLQQPAPSMNSDAQPSGDKLPIANNDSSSPFQLKEDQRESNQTGLPHQLKAGIEQLSGHSLDDVRVHYNSSQPAQFNALAYAQGTDIHVGPQQERHLPHEAWHVVQQKQNRVKPTTQLNGQNVNDDVQLESEADRMGAKAMQLKLDDSISQHISAPFPIVQRKIIQREPEENVDSKEATDGQANDGVSGGDYIEIKEVKEQFQEASASSAVADVGKIYSQNSGQIEAAFSSPKETPKIQLNIGEAPKPKEVNGVQFTGGKMSVKPQESDGTSQMKLASRSPSIIQRAHNPIVDLNGVPIQMVQAQRSGNFNENAARPNAVNALPNRNIAYGGAIGNGTGSTVVATGLNNENYGSGVGNYRPSHWARFTTLTGGNPYYQLHLMNDNLSGRGEGQNLVPGSPSFNSQHSAAVEEHVKDWAGTSTTNTNVNQVANYSVVSQYGNPPQIINKVQTDHQNTVDYVQRARNAAQTMLNNNNATIQNSLNIPNNVWNSFFQTITRQVMVPLVNNFGVPFTTLTGQQIYVPQTRTVHVYNQFGQYVRSFQQNVTTTQTVLARNQQGTTLLSAYVLRHYLAIQALQRNNDRQFLDNYVDETFTSRFRCTATFYGPNPAPNPNNGNPHPAFAHTNAQVVDITYQ